MNRFFILMVGGVASLVATGAASAAPPAWCKEASVRSPDLRRLSSKEVREVITAFVGAECAPTAEVLDHRGEIEAARQAWSKKLGMTEADWADAVAYAETHDDYSIVAEVSAKTLAAATPIDQYAVITKAGASFSELDPIYATDMFDARLSEAGRLAFLETTCLNNGEPATVHDNGMTKTEVPWAICQADLERIDVAKLFGEIRGDAAHDGAIKMKLRIAAYKLPRQLKDHAAEVQQMLQRDDANKQVFAAAAAGREAWASGIGKDTKLLDLVLAMDSAAIMKSRKQLEGCGETTAAALAQAVSAIPAKAFDGIHDERYDPTAGFATKAGPVLGQSPAVTLAAIAFIRCTPEGDLPGFLGQIVAYAAPMRGPRNAALAKIKSTKITYDKLEAKLMFPRVKPYGDGYLDGSGAVHSAGGPIKSVKREGNMLTVELQPRLVKTNDCVRSHNGKAVRIRDNGSIEYESICDKTAVQTHDTAWVPLKVSAKYAAWLKPGVVFSTVGEDVIAVWPSATAKLPSLVLGGAVK